MPLVIPNSIENDTPADAAELQANFTTIETYVNTNMLNRDGSVALTSPLLLPGDPTQDNQAANKGYVDGRDALKVAKAGDTLTGQLKGITPVAAEDLARKDYVDTKLALTGGTVSGDVVFNGVVSANNDIYIDSNPTHLWHAARKDYVDLQDAAYYNSSVTRMDTQDNLRVNKAGDTMGGYLYMGNVPNVATGVAGLQLRPDGEMYSVVTSGANPGSLPNIVCGRQGTQPQATGGAFIRFERLSTSTQCGLVSITSIGGTNYGETSDYRVKDDLGPIDDPLGVIDALQPKHLRMKEGGVEFDGFIAHEVAEVVPVAVVGEKDADDLQQLDTGKLIPYLVAAVQQLAARVAELEAA